MSATGTANRVYDKMQRSLGLDHDPLGQLFDEDAIREYLSNMKLDPAHHDNLVETLRAHWDLTPYFFTVVFTHVRPASTAARMVHLDGGIDLYIDENSDVVVYLPEEWVNFGDVARGHGLGQCQYISRHLDPVWGDDWPYLGEGLNLRVPSRSDYHSILIHRDSIPVFLRKYEEMQVAQRRAAGLI